MMKRVRTCITAVLMALVLSAGISATLPGTAGLEAQAASAKLSKKSVVINVGKTCQLKVQNAKGKITWKTSKKAVATVKNGKVTAKKAGTAKITATVKGKKYTCKVTVEAPELSQKALNLKPGGTYQLSVKKTRQQVSWASSNPMVVEIAQDGTVMAKAVGTATVTAMVNKTKFTCKIVVSESAPANPLDPIPPADANAVDLTFETVGGGSFVYGVSSAKISFHLDNTSEKVVVSIKDPVGDTIYTKQYAQCTAGKTVEFTWDGKTSSGTTAAAGTYTVSVKAGTVDTVSDGLIIRENIFAGGTGSQQDPFQVTTLEQIRRIGEYNGNYFKQMADISGNEIEQISPQFSENNPFNGTYNGNGFKIKDLSIHSTTNNTAMFGAVGENGRLENIQMERVSIFGKGNTAGLVCTNNGKINNCAMRSCKIIQGDSSSAAILCINNKGFIAACVVEDCELANSVTNVCVAGIVLTNDTTGILRDCKIARCNLNCPRTGWPNGGCAGGIVQYNGGTMQNCQATDVNITLITSDRTRSGGVCDQNYGEITNCSFTGTADTLGVYANRGVVS